MILLNDFFSITQQTNSDGNMEAVLEINKGHRIFEGHFPNQPVVPGVCMMQMIKELLEQELKKETELLSAAEMKFLAVIDPTRNNVIHASIKYSAEGDQLKVTASLFKSELMHFKFKGVFVFP